MKTWLKRLAVAGALAAVAAAVVRKKNTAPFDPARPRHDWGTTSLTIDDAR